MTPPTPARVSRASIRPLLSRRDSDRGHRTQTPTLTQMYRIDEYRRTFYIASPAPPAQDIDTIMTEVTDMSEEHTTSSSQPPSYRSKSLTEREILPVVDENRPNLSQGLADRTTRHGLRSSVSLRSQTSANTPPNTPATPHPHGSRPSRTPTRHRILFYHRRDPHYGFTNFSSHPVFYQGKRYPTSEHLFQSFKVGRCTMTLRFKA
jgi:hypothetical protein